MNIRNVIHTLDSTRKTMKTYFQHLSLSFQDRPHCRRQCLHSPHTQHIKPGYCTCVKRLKKLKVSWEPNTELWRPCCMGSCSVTSHPTHRWTHPSQAGQYSTYLPRREGRLSWPGWFHSSIVPVWGRAIYRPVGLDHNAAPSAIPCGSSQSWILNGNLRDFFL